MSSAFGVVVDGMRLLWQHWPVLVLIFLLGAAAREGVLWLSFATSKVSPLASSLIIPLAPLATLTALILMLRHLLPSLRHVEGEPIADSMSTRLKVVASALVPFLALYAAQGYLREDTRRYLNEVYADESRSTNWFIGESMGARTIADLDGWVVIVTVLVALGVRWAIDRFDLPDRSAFFGLVAAWVEAVWLVFAAKAVASGFGFWAWARGRVGVEWLVDGWAWVVGVLGPLGGAMNRLVTWLWSVLGDFDTLVVIPLAWLTVGAVVYGRELAQPAPGPGLPVAHDPRLRHRLESAAELRLRVRRKARVDRLPSWLRGWVVAPITSVRNRFAGLGRGLLTLVRAGLVPMITLCLVFVLARQAENGVGHLLRRLVGPRDPELSVAIAGYVDIAMSTVGFVIMAVLVAAAVDRFLVQPAQEVEQERAQAALQEVTGGDTPAAT